MRKQVSGFRQEEVGSGRDSAGIIREGMETPGVKPSGKILLKPNVVFHLRMAS